MYTAFIIGLVLIFLAGAFSGAPPLAGSSGGGIGLPPPSDNTPTPGQVIGTVMSITYDPQTWPSGDCIWNICRAIAAAEGANISGSNPDRLNNPGDIGDGFNTFGGETHSGSSITHFPDKSTGWSWLYSKVQNIATNSSLRYSAYDSWNVIAQKWAGDWQSWVTNVTSALNVDPNSTVNDYCGMA
jgi:hypothetical protein